MVESDTRVTIGEELLFIPQRHRVYEFLIYCVEFMPRHGDKKRVLLMLFHQGMEKKEAMKQVAKDRGVGKRDIYQALL